MQGISSKIIQQVSTERPPLKLTAGELHKERFVASNISSAFTNNYYVITYTAQLTCSKTSSGRRIS